MTTTDTPTTRPLAERITESGYTPLQFVSYLRHTLIPDFHAADMHATATDFETALQFICQLADERAELIEALTDCRDTLRNLWAIQFKGTPPQNDTIDHATELLTSLNP